MVLGYMIINIYIYISGVSGRGWGGGGVILVLHQASRLDFLCARMQRPFRQPLRRKVSCVCRPASTLRILSSERKRCMVFSWKDFSGFRVDLSGSEGLQTDWLQGFRLCELDF